MGLHLRSLLMAVVALLVLAPRVVADVVRSSGPANSGWQRIDLPFEADGRLVSTIFRDTLFVGSTAKTGQQALGAIPLLQDSAGLCATAFALPLEFRITRVSGLVSMGDSLIAWCEVASEDRRHDDGMFVYDGRWRRFPAMPDWPSQSIGGLQHLGGVLYAHGRFRSSPEAPCDNVIAWDGQTWRALGLQLGWHYVGSLAVHDGALTGVFSKLDGELDESWLPQQYSRLHLASWDGSAWRTLFEGRGGFLASPVVHCGELYVAQTRRSTRGAGSADVVRLADGDLIRLGEEFGLSAGWNADVDRLVEFRGRLIAAGSFDHVGGVVAGSLVFWDGAIWRAFGALEADTGADLLLADGQRFWVGGWSPEAAAGRGPARIYCWDEDPPAQVPPAPYTPPPVETPTIAARSDTIPPFRNGMFVDWADGSPMGWELDASTLWRAAALLSIPVCRDSLTPLPDGGVSLWPDPTCKYPLTLGQSFSIKPGRCYRLRATVRHSPLSIAGEAAMETASRLQFSLGGAWDALDLLSTGFADVELALLAPDGADQGSVMFTCGRMTERLEILAVDVAESPLDFGACFTLFEAEFEARYAFPFVKREEWHDDLAVLRPAAAQAVNSEAFQNILHEALRSLRDPEIRTVANHSDMTAIGMIYDDDERPPYRVLSGLPEPGERMLRLPCGVNVIYRER